MATLRGRVLKVVPSTGSESQGTEVTIALSEVQIQEGAEVTVRLVVAGKDDLPRAEALWGY